ncbi:MAG: hypothetical protein AAGI24_04620 [Pseudomonadota bacterium]
MKVNEDDVVVRIPRKWVPYNTVYRLVRLKDTDARLRARIERGYLESIEVISLARKPARRVLISGGEELGPDTTPAYLLIPEEIKETAWDERTSMLSMRISLAATCLVCASLIWYTEISRLKKSELLKRALDRTLASAPATELVLERDVIEVTLTATTYGLIVLTVALGFADLINAVREQMSFFLKALWYIAAFGLGVGCFWFFERTKRVSMIMDRSGFDLTKAVGGGAHFVTWPELESVSKRAGSQLGSLLRLHTKAGTLHFSTFALGLDCDDVAHAIETYRDRATAYAKSQK